MLTRRRADFYTSNQIRTGGAVNTFLPINDLQSLGKLHYWHVLCSEEPYSLPIHPVAPPRTTVFG